MRCGRLLREREPVAVFFTGKGNENTWKNTCLQYENSLTRQAEESMDIWTKELADMSEELMNDPMAVVRSLNDARNLCTAGFLMRRQIQASFF